MRLFFKFYILFRFLLELVSYLHPRDFDNKQPFNTLSYSCHLKSRIGIRTAAAKLEYLIKNFKFADISQVFELIDWSTKDHISIKSI